MAREPKVFLSLELGRGVAAVLVLMYHVDKFYFSSSVYFHNELFAGIFKFGHAGVEFFFVLSGFIMVWTRLG